MLTATASSTAPAPLLWARVSDVTSWPKHLETFDSVRHAAGPHPLGLGSRYDVAQPGLKPGTYEVTVLTPGASFTWVGRFRGVTATATHVVSATDVGSRIELGIGWTGPLAPVVRLLLGRRTQRMIDLEATTLAALAAADGAARG